LEAPRHSRATLRTDPRVIATGDFVMFCSSCGLYEASVERQQAVFGIQIGRTGGQLWRIMAAGVSDRVLK